MADEPANETERRIFDYLCTKYVQRADDRQRSMGLQYTEAETHDLAREMNRLFDTLNEGARRVLGRVTDYLAANLHEDVSIIDAIEYWKEGTKIVEERIRSCDDLTTAPFPMTGGEILLWQKARREAYQDALEMVGFPQSYRVDKKV